MNNELQAFARNELKMGLSKLPEKNLTVFKRMYANCNLKMDINNIVDSIPEEKLDWAMQQVQRTLNQHKSNN